MKKNVTVKKIRIANLLDSKVPCTEEKITGTIQTSGFGRDGEEDFELHFSLKIQHPL